jgi:hypothetical protein
MSQVVAAICSNIEAESAVEQQEELEEWQAWQLEHEEKQQQLDPTLTAAYSRPQPPEIPAGEHGECVTLFKTFTPEAEEYALKKLEGQPGKVYAHLRPPSPW